MSTFNDMKFKIFAKLSSVIPHAYQREVILTTILQGSTDMIDYCLPTAHFCDLYFCGRFEI